MNLEKLAGDLVSITGTLGSITAQLTGIVAVLAGQAPVSTEDTTAAVVQSAAQGQKRVGKGSAGEVSKASGAAVDVPAGALSATISTGTDNGRTRLPNGLFAEGLTVKLTGPNGKSLEITATADARAKMGKKAAESIGLGAGQTVLFTRTGKGSKGAAYVVSVIGAAGPKASGKKAGTAPAADAFDSLDLDAAAIDALDLNGPVEAPKAEKPTCAECGRVAVKKAGQLCGRCKRAAEAPKASGGKKSGGKSGKGSRPAALKGASKAKRDAAKQVAALTGGSLTQIAETMREALERHPTPETTRVGK